MNSKEFGRKLRELRTRAGFSQRELAELIGVDFTYLSKIENGTIPPPSEKVIRRLGEALNADVDELMILAGKIPADIVQELLRNKETLQTLRSSRSPQKSKATRNTIRRSGMSAIKNLLGYNKIYRVAIAFVLVCAVAASLWFASPQPVRALDVEFPTVPSGTLGSTHYFTIKVDIPNPELVPIQSINMQIYSVIDSSKTVTCNNLPLTSGQTTNYATTGGTVSITASGTNWQEFTATGYANWKGTGYDFSPPNVFGYGYQFAGTASMEYTGSWTSPADWPSGGYKIRVDIVASSAALTKTFTELSSQFTLTQAPVAGGGAEVVSAGILDVSDIVNPYGVFTESVTHRSADKKVTLDIPRGTTGKTARDRALSRISVTPMADPPEAPEDANIIGLVYDLGPDGATFEPAITLTFTYDPDELSADAVEEDLTIAMWDETAGENGEWVVFTDVVVNTEDNTITVSVSHFTAFAVLEPVPAPPAEVPTVPTVPPAVPEPAAFAVSNLTVQPAEVEPDESVTITVSVANTGGSEGSYAVVLKINGVKEVEKSVTVDAGATKSVSFSVAKAETGSYSVTVDGLSGSFTVVAPAVVPPPTEVPEEVPAPTPIAWWVWLIVGIVAVAIIAVIVWLVMRRRA